MNVIGLQHSKRIHFIKKPHMGGYLFYYIHLIFSILGPNYMKSFDCMSEMAHKEKNMFVRDLNLGRGY